MTSGNTEELSCLFLDSGEGCVVVYHILCVMSLAACDSLTNAFKQAQGSVPLSCRGWFCISACELQVLKGSFRE